MKERLQCDIAVVGGGVIGLAVARELATASSGARSVCLLEKNEKFGQETSSRNSEVIHSGIYYPAESYKTRWCIEGRQELYDYCGKHHVPHKKTGKLVVATCPEEEAYLVKLLAHCRAVGVPAEMWEGQRIAGAESLVRATRAVWLPETGVVDSHSFMASLARQLEEAGGMIGYRHTVGAVEPSGAGWRLEAQSPSGVVDIHAQKVVNAAGLGAAELSNRALGAKKYEHRFCRGRYFTLPSSYRQKFHHLIYPVPPKDGLGVHVTLDLEGEARLGPDVDWCPGVNYAKAETLYDCDWERLRAPFAAAARRYLPGVEEQTLAPGLIGIRAKLFIEGAAHPDFLVEQKGSFVHCLGIESPGLTASLAIAKAVASLI